MKLKFTKMHGCGNDYVYINCFNQIIRNPNKLAVMLSDRHFGIGADGMILVCPSEIVDAKMRMFNADGSEGKMCGNGIRCVGKFLYDNKLVDFERDYITVDTLSGVKSMKTLKEYGDVTGFKVNMGSPEFNLEKIPVKIGTQEKKIIDYPFEIDGVQYKINCVSMGNPHCVIFVDDTDNYDVEGIGVKFERNEIFPEQVNTEFVQVVDKNHLKMRVWERGSGETGACGTGACASVVCAIENGFCEKNTDIEVDLLGGTLTICWENDIVYMTGEAVKVFEGVIEI